MEDDVDFCHCIVNSREKRNAFNINYFESNPDFFLFSWTSKIITGSEDKEVNDSSVV